MWISLIFDSVVAALLGVTIFYCYLVNRKLTALRSGKDELRKVIEDLAVATTSAQMSIGQLKDAGKQVVGTLELDVRKGRALADELALMVEAGNNLAERLEGGRATRSVPGRGEMILDEEAPPYPGRRLPDVHLDTEEERSKASVKSTAADSAIENELLKALRRAR